MQFMYLEGSTHRDTNPIVLLLAQNKHTFEILINYQSIEMRAYWDSHEVLFEDILSLSL